ncbi:MAG: hypothetical protein ACFE0R_19945 [Salinarimonas sp.]
MRRLHRALAGAFALVSIPAAALAQDVAEPGAKGRTVGETIFSTMAAEGREAIHAGDLERFRDSVFVGMDHDEDGVVTYPEFAAWDPGFAIVAEEVGRSDAYTTASKIVFAVWDRDGDGGLTAPEMRFAMAADFRRADLDDNALLTRDEFIQGFLVMVAMRAAIRPDL